MSLNDLQHPVAEPSMSFVFLDDDRDARVVFGTDFSTSPQIRRKVLSDGSVVLDVTPARAWAMPETLNRHQQILAPASQWPLLHARARETQAGTPRANTPRAHSNHDDCAMPPRTGIGHQRRSSAGWQHTPTTGG